MSIFDTILEALKEAEVDYTGDKENGTIRFHIQSKGLYRVVYIVFEEDEWMFCAAAFPLSVPAEKIAQAYAKVNQMNNDYLFATMLLDAEDGTLSCRVSCPVDGGEITKETVLLELSAAVQCLDKYYEDLLKLITE